MAEGQLRFALAEIKDAQKPDVLHRAHQQWQGPCRSPSHCRPIFNCVPSAKICGTQAICGAKASVPNIVRPEAGPAYMYGTIWIGKDGQPPMRFTMVLPDNIASKDGIVWSTLMPPEDMTAWLSVDLKRELVEIDLSRAEPVVI